MAENTYSRKPSKMLCSGLNTLLPPDLLPPGKFSRLKNVRADFDLGTLEPRPGIQAVNATAMTISGGIGVHSIRRLNDNIGVDSNFVGDFTYVVGSGTTVNIGTGTMTLMDTGYSGRPMSLTPWRPNASPRTWMYVWDHLKQTKIGRNNNIPSAVYKVYGTGIERPALPPIVTVGVAGGPTGTYLYRYRYRSQITGARSNPSPVPVTGSQGSIVLANQAANILLTASTDLQMTDVDATGMIDIFRFGGNLLDYRYVGSVPNGGPLTFVDSAQDVDLQSAELLDTDLDQPFTTVGLPMSGTCSYATNTPFVGVTTLTRLSGRAFLTDNNGLKMAPGTIINVGTTAGGSVNVELFTQPTNDNTLIFRNPTPAIGSNPGPVPFTIAEPNLMAKTLEWVWGPFQNSLFAVGDFFRPGVLYWTNGNDPDTASSENSVEITNQSEPLMNGFTLSGRAFVFSSERLFAIYPAFSETETWTILETPCQRGLLYNWCICTEGEKEGARCWFLAKDGIYETQGGLAISITDADLYNLFPHEGNVGTPTQLGATQIQPADLANTAQRAYFRLEHYQGKVYFDYIDILGNIRTLVYDVRTKGWFPDDYTPDLRMHYGGEGREVVETLGGSDDGRFYRYVGTTDGPEGASIACQVRTRSDDFDDPGVVKEFGDYTHEISTPNNNVTIQPFYNNESQTLPAQVVTAAAGRVQRIFDINTLARNMALDFTWASTGPQPTKLFMYLPSAIPKPEDAQKRIVEWHEFIPGADDAYVMGLRIWCDTRDLNNIPQTKTIQVWADNVFTGNTFTVNSSVTEDKIEVSWPAFKGKLARLVPTDTNRWRVFKWEWIAQNEPFLVSKWDTNWRAATEGNMPGYVTGVSVTADTLNISKQLIFQSELEGVQIFHIPADGISSFTWNGRTTKTFSFSPPFRAEELRLYSSDGVTGRLYDVEWVVQPTEPRKLTNFSANWEDGGFLGAKFMQGCIIDADTEGQQKIVNIEFEDGNVETITINHAKRMGRPYSFRFPVIANKLRALPQDTNPSWFYNIRYIWEPAPELVDTYETQGTSFGLPGYWHQRDGYIALISYSTVYLTITQDNLPTYTIALPSTAGIFRKIYVSFPSVLGKLVSYKVTSWLPAGTTITYTATL